jgi:PAS domain S-box-containing protein
MKDLFLKALDHINNGVVITDPSMPDNPIVYVNPGFEVISGYLAKEVIGKNCRFLQGTEKVQPALDELRKAIRSRKQAHVIIKNYRKDGRLFYNELYVSPVRHKGKTYFIGIQNDVTARVEAEKKLQRYNQELESKVEERTLSLREMNLNLIGQIEERKEAEIRVLRLNERLKAHSSRIEKRLSKEARQNLTYNEKVGLYSILGSRARTKKQLAEESGIPSSTLSVMANRFKTQGLLKRIAIPSFDQYSLLSIIYFRQPHKTNAIKDAFFGCSADHGILMYLTADWLELERLVDKDLKSIPDYEAIHLSVRSIDLINLFDFSNFFAKEYGIDQVRPADPARPVVSPKEHKIRERDARVLYGLAAYPQLNQVELGKRIDLSVPTIIRSRRMLEASTIIQYRNILDLNSVSSILALIKSEKTLETAIFSLRHKTVFYHIALFSSYSDLHEKVQNDDLVVVDLKGCDWRLDFSQTIKRRFLL